MAATTVLRSLLQRGFTARVAPSRDHRPDLNQVMLDRMVEHQAGIPLLMKPLSGHSSAGQDFGQVVTEHIEQLQTTYGTTYLVADSAL
jgi:transposase